MSYVRSEISKKNEYWISNYRYYELKYFCLQYSEYRRLCGSFDGYAKHAYSSTHAGGINKPTEKTAEVREYYDERVRMIEKAAGLTDPILGNYILIGVTNGLAYDKIKARLNIPCGKDVYYKLYHKYFYILDRLLR